MSDGMSEEEALRRAAEILSNADEVALACHMNPDADALGSMLGLSNFLRSRGASDGLLVRERAAGPAAVGHAAAGDRSPGPPERVP